MSMQDGNPGSIEVSIVEQHQDDAWVINSIANATPPLASTTRIHRVPIMVRESEDYEEYYVPKVVSIGPYHFGKKKLELVEKLKPVFTMKLLSDNKEMLKCLYEKLGEAEMVQELRDFYEEKSTNEFCNKVFTKMMLLDGCFILYYILYIFGGDLKNCPELKNHQLVFVHQDLFLLENQIPFKVLNEVISLINNPECRKKMKSFIDDNILASAESQKRRWFEKIFCFPPKQIPRVQSNMDLNVSHNHLLHFLHGRLTKNVKIQTDGSKQTDNYNYTFRNVNELKDVGINFKPSNTMCLARIGYTSSWWMFSANVELPPITVDDSTKPMLLNLIAYEMSSCEAQDSWVTSYICLLDTLIDHSADVKTLRQAGVLDNSLGSDKEVATLFNEIGTGLVPNHLAYLDAKNRIQKHYKSWRNTVFSQLKHEYVKSPWAFFALLGALMALFLSGVQAYYTVWSPKRKCDDLCVFLKMNHHL